MKYNKAKMISYGGVFKNALKSIKKYWETERTEKEGMGNDILEELKDYLKKYEKMEI